MARLEAMLDDVRDFAQQRKFETFHDPKNLAMAIASEAGELVAELRWVSNERADAHCREPDARKRITDEMADVAICLLLLCDRLGVDLDTIVHDKLVRTRAKYPLEESIGNPDAPKNRG